MQLQMAAALADQVAVVVEVAFKDLQLLLKVATVVFYYFIKNEGK
jgi:hypothetical protein